jgi:archaemetzincin
MQVLVLEAEGLRPGAGRLLLDRLPPPFAGGRAEPCGIDLEPCRDERRGQLDAGCLLELLPEPPADTAVLLLTQADLFLPVFSYVLGASQLGARRSVLSLARLELDGDPPARGADAMPPPLLRRALVESLHELGHGLGLVHCPVPDCAMHRTHWPEALDLKAAAYCPSCRDALDRAL